MGRFRKRKLAYKLTGILLCNALVGALVVMLLAGLGIRAIEKNVLAQYESNLIHQMEYLDEEFIQLREILWYSLQDESVVMLQEWYEDMSDYDKVRSLKEVRQELSAYTGQYRWISDMGVYLSEPDRYLTASGADILPSSDTGLLAGMDEFSVLENGELLLLENYTRNNRTAVSYAVLDSNEFSNLLSWMRFSDRALLDVKVCGETFLESGAENHASWAYSTVSAQSSLFPIEITIHIPRWSLSESWYLAVICLLSVLVLTMSALMFARSLSKAIHTPLENIMAEIEEIGEESFETELLHKGVDEFTYVTNGFNKLKNTLQIYIKAKYEQELSMKQMELDHLQSQVKPHFLYNCFFNIENLCKTYDVDKVEQLSRALARYYRYITRTGQDLVTLEEEYDHMRNYLTVQKIRFADRVEISVEQLTEKCAATRVPRLILQPIVENAYKYAFERVAEGGKLLISASEIREEDGREGVKLKIEDNGGSVTREDISRMQQKLESTDGPITGLVNINTRLKYRNRRNGLQLSLSSLGGLCVEVIIYR